MIGLLYIELMKMIPERKMPKGKGYGSSKKTKPVKTSKPIKKK